MNSSNRDIYIKWSPLTDEDFILVGNSVAFYRIYNDGYSKNRIENNLYISENSYAKLIGTINNFPGYKLVSWYPGFDSSYYTIALHEYNTSQINILRLFNQTDNQTSGSFLDIEKSRKSNQIEWNPTKFNYLGVCFDELENASSLYIWDAHQQTGPIYQLEEFDTCCSFAWHPENPDILFSTSINRSISLYDLRVGTKAIESVKTDFINEFSIDFKNSFHAASYDNNKIAIWDLRKIKDTKEPFGFIEEAKQIKKIQFCPNKADRLAVLSEGSANVNVYRLEEKETFLNKEQIQYLKSYKNTAILNTFSWHSKDFNKLMINFSGGYNLLMDLIVAEYSPIGLSANETLNIVSNDTINLFDLNKINDEFDIGEKIKKRAKESYGVQDFLLNIDLLSSDKSENDVKYLWTWLDLSKKISDSTLNFVDKYSGVKLILQSTPQEVTYQNHDLNEIKKVFIQKLCGWYNWNETVSKLEEKGEYERAACISVFNRGIDRAIQILTNASASSKLNEYLALSIALSFNRTPNFDSKESCKILNKLNNPYLKALFCYEIDPDNYEKNSSIYNDPNILLPDRVCMAMSMLKHDQLIHYINRLTTEFIKQGNLYGILLTGLNLDCVDLFQYYIHRTSDVQTPAVAIIHSTVSKIFNSKFVNAWIESYRDLLDSWMLWEERSMYDIQRAKPCDPKINVRCTYCGDNISSRRRTKIAYTETANIFMTCQACQKPSLRCSVCSLHMTIDPPKSGFNGEKNKMFFWFLFCQKCSHGGHLGHLDSWFKTNPECPVMACTCQCYIKEDLIQNF